MVFYKVCVSIFEEVEADYMKILQGLLPGFVLVSCKTAHQTMWVILNRLPMKGRKMTEGLVSIHVGKERERNRDGREKVNDSQETEEMQTYSFFPLPGRAAGPSYYPTTLLPTKKCRRLVY